MPRLIRTLLICSALTLSACLSATTTPIPDRPDPGSSTEPAMPSTPTTEPAPTAAILRPGTLQRGINLGNMLEAPHEGDWGFTVQEEYFDSIKEAGFDFVRLPVRWNTHAEEAAPYAIDPAFFVRVDKIVGWALERDLAFILDFHHYDEMMTDPRGHRERYLAIWQQVAGHYKDSPPGVLFELLNEPTNQLDASLWNEYLVEALRLIRETNPGRDVIVGPANLNAYDSLPTLELPEDEHLIVTFHYYLPFQFTHQGAEWVDGSSAWLGTRWEATEVERAEISSHFNLVAEWADRNNVRILLGEFGAYSRADTESRIRWTNYVAREAERHGFAWAYWEFAAGFGAYDPAENMWRQELLKALIP